MNEGGLRRLLSGERLCHRLLQPKFDAIVSCDQDLDQRISRTLLRIATLAEDASSA